MDLQVLKVCVLGTVQVDRREVKLRYYLLVVDLVFVKDLHVREHRTRHGDEELRHFEDLALTASYQEGLSVYFLSDIVEVAKDDPALGETKNAVEWTLGPFEDVDDIFCGLFKSVDAVRYFGLLLFLCTPTVELEPRFEMSIVIWQKSSHFFYRWLVTLERGINNLEFNDFPEDQPEVTHLVLHDVFVGVVTMQTEHF